MTIAAESFAGRVLAVFSRRSPGFRPALKTSGMHTPGSSASSSPAPIPDAPRSRETPPADPAQDDVTGLRLADVTARWKSVAPQERFRHRGELLKVADFLAAAATALKLTRDRTHSPYHRPYRSRSLDPLERAYRQLRGDLDPDRELARDLARALTRHTIYVGIRDPDPDPDPEFSDEIPRSLTGAADRDPKFLDEIRRSLAYARDRDSEHNPLRARARALALAVALGRDLDRDRALDLAFSFDRVSDTSELHQDCIQAQRNLADAASDFVGADLRTVNPAEINLAGIRWDSGTRWPTPEWTVRIRGASVEDAHGSGVFIILPDEGNNLADRGSLTPTS